MGKKEGRAEIEGVRTGGIGQFILATLDLVLQTLSFAPGRGNLGLHLFACHIGSHNAGPLMY